MTSITLRLAGAPEQVSEARHGREQDTPRSRGLLGQVADEPELKKRRRPPPSSALAPATAEGDR